MKFNKEYESLIKKVADIDENAAKYLKKDAYKLPDFRQSGYLSTCFLWSNAKQGYDYWNRIDNLLIEKERKENKDGYYTVEGIE